MNALKAVLYPEANDYLYFVAEKDGHHRFTRTYAEHLQAIADIEKSPAPTKDAAKQDVKP
jgi:UPF0755 protein